MAGNNEQELLDLRDALMQEFPITDLKTPHYFLGMKIKFRTDGIYLSQQAFMERLLERFNMTECKPTKTPMEARVNSTTEEGAEYIIEVKPYRELVGCLIYLMIYTRPDISTAINYCSRFQNCATESQWNCLKRILCYIKGTLDYGLFFQKKKCSEPLLAYVDADWTNDSDRRSITGYLVQIYGATVT